MPGMSSQVLTPVFDFFYGFCEVGWLVMRNKVFQVVVIRVSIRVRIAAATVQT